MSECADGCSEGHTYAVGCALMACPRCHHSAVGCLPRWTIDVEDGDNPEPDSWNRVASGRSRFRALCAFLICTFARPNDVHRLYWRTNSIGVGEEAQL